MINLNLKNKYFNVTQLLKKNRSTQQSLIVPHCWDETWVMRRERGNIITNSLFSQ